MNLLSLPIEMIYKILSYLTYDQIAKMRAVNRAFNSICSDKLNKGIIKLEQFHGTCVKAVKSKLPRRESERKHHPLSRQNDILMAVETRLSMLSMTYTKYIESLHCCFIPGKVLDEAFKVLRAVNDTSTLSTSSKQYQSLPRPHDFLQEYRDVSSMAMEHFEEKILPPIREKLKYENPRLFSYRCRSSRFPVLGQSLKTAVPRNIKTCACRVCTVSTEVPDAHKKCGLAAGEASKGDGSNMVTMPTSTLFSVLFQTKVKCSQAHRAITGLHRQFKTITKKLNRQNVMLKRKLDHQSAVIKKMKREMRDTRNTMRIMNKDLNCLKIEPSPSRDLTPLERPMNNTFSVTVTSSVSLPVKKEEPSSDCKGIKRKSHSCEENSKTKR